MEKNILKGHLQFYCRVRLVPDSGTRPRPPYQLRERPAFLLAHAQGVHLRRRKRRARGVRMRAVCPARPRPEHLGLLATEAGRVAVPLRARCSTRAHRGRPRPRPSLPCCDCVEVSLCLPRPRPRALGPRGVGPRALQPALPRSAGLAVAPRARSRGAR